MITSGSFEPTEKGKMTMPLRCGNTQERGRTMNTTEQILPGEQWLPIPGYEGFYEVSDKGRVKSLSRLVGGNKSQKTWRIKERILDGSIFKYGHIRVELYKDGKYKRAKVHQLVMQAFVGNPPKGLCCCHNDGNASNNSLSNLRYDTQKSNMRDSIVHGSFPVGERSGSSKISESMALSVIEMLLSGKSRIEISNSLNVSFRIVRSISERKTWKHLTEFIPGTEPIGLRRYKGLSHFMTPQEQNAGWKAE